MGWERKRGKLHELNQLLRGATNTTFIAIRAGHAGIDCRTCATSSRSTPTRACRAVRSARLVGTMAHPLNRPEFSAERRPRGGRLRHRSAAHHAVAADATAKARCFRKFSPARAESILMLRPFPTCIRIFSAKDRYTGKGIYDLDAFEAGAGGQSARTTLC